MFHTSRALFIIVAFIVLLTVYPAAIVAQTPPTCPANVLLAFARMSAACAAVGLDEVCYGSGTVSAETFDAGAPTLQHAGDHVPAASLQEVTAASEPGTWSTALLSLRASLDRSQRQTLTMILFGSATLTNQVTPEPETPVLTIGSANLRAEPRSDSPILARVNVNETLVANGRYEAGWLRVFVPNMNAVGWVSTDVIQNAASLPLTQVESWDYHRPFEIISFSSGAQDAPCEGAPGSGMLVQSPDVVHPVSLMLAPTLGFRLAGTAYLQGDTEDRLTIQVIDGFALISDGTREVYTPAGAQVVATFGAEIGVSDAQPFDEAAVKNLPIANLPYRVRAIPPMLTLDEIATLTARHLAAEATPAPVEPTPDTTCRRVMVRADDLRAGPGDFYEITGSLRQGAAITAVLQAADPNGVIWYQTSGGSWVKAGSIAESGICLSVPTTVSAPPPGTNHLTMETCGLSNGPIRAGQQVTLQFTPPSWETYADAQNAPSVDPGHFTIDGVRYYSYAGNPIRLTPTAVARTFYGTWMATVGTHHIVSSRLSYSLVCDLTVPAG